MNHLTTYIRTRLVTLARFNHPPGEPHVDPPDEEAGEYSINFSEEGSYFLQIERRRWEMSPGLIFITRPELVFRCRHPSGVPTDVSFSVSYDPRCVRDTEGDYLPRRFASASPVAALTNRLAYLHLRLRHIAVNKGDALSAEVLAGELLLALSQDGHNKKHRPYKARLFSWYAERVEAARVLMDSQYDAAHTLFSLARLTGMSPFHFSRVFRELTGIPPHRYLLDVRLRNAAARLRDGDGVTETCFGTGFNNLSHFIRLFKRAYGVPPSQYTKTRRYKRCEAL